MTKTNEANVKLLVAADEALDVKPDLARELINMVLKNLKNGNPHKK